MVGTRKALIFKHPNPNVQIDQKIKHSMYTLREINKMKRENRRGKRTCEVL